MIHCFKCGSDAPDDMSFCLNCGERLDGETATVVRSAPTTRRESPKMTTGQAVGMWAADTARSWAIFLIIVIGFGIVGGIAYIVAVGK